jgi:quinol monooxygenase YgiN
MITVTGTIACTNAIEAEIVRSHLPEHIRLSRDEPGCISFSVLPTSDPLVWRLDESFTDMAAYEAHRSRTRASAWYKATAHLQRDFKVSGT